MPISIIHIFTLLVAFGITLPGVTVANVYGNSVQVRDLIVSKGSFTEFRLSQTPDTVPTISSTDRAIASVKREENKKQQKEGRAQLTPAKHQSDTAVFELETLVNIALKNNRTIEIVRQQLMQNRGQLTQAKSGYLPHLTLEGGYYYAEEEDSDSVSAVEEGDVVQGTGTLSQLLYDFGRTPGAISEGESHVMAAEANLQRQLQDIIYQVKVAYYTVLEKQKLIDVAEASVKSFKEHSDRAKRYFAAGMFTKIDVVKSEVELSNAQMALLRSRYEMKIARVALEQVLGIVPGQGRYELHGQEGVVLDTLLDTMPPVFDSLDNLIGFALKKRPDIVQLEQLVEAAKAGTERIEGDNWPTINAEAKYTDYNTDVSSYDDSWRVGVSATWDLFSSLHTRGAMAEAKSVQYQNRARLQNLQLQVVKEVTESYLRADEYREGVRIALETLKLSEEEVALANKRYQFGEYDVIEFNDAQLNLTQAQADLVVSYYGYLAEFAGIEFAIGMSSYRESVGANLENGLYVQSTLGESHTLQRGSSDSSN